MLDARCFDSTGCPWASKQAKRSFGFLVSCARLAEGHAREPVASQTGCVWAEPGWYQTQVPGTSRPMGGYAHIPRSGPMCPSGQWMNSRPLVRVQRFGARWCASIVSLPSLARRPSPFPRAPLSRTHNITHPRHTHTQRTTHHAPRQAPRSRLGWARLAPVPAALRSCAACIRRLTLLLLEAVKRLAGVWWPRSHTSGQSVNASRNSCLDPSRVLEFQVPRGVLPHPRASPALRSVDPRCPGLPPPVLSSAWLWPAWARANWCGWLSGPQGCSPVCPSSMSVFLFVFPITIFHPLYCCYFLSFPDAFLSF